MDAEIEGRKSMSKVVVITGSPRKDGNSDLLAEAFIDAAKAKGHTVERFDAGRMKIQGCHACNTCYKTGKPCTFDDDFNQIAPAVLEAHAVVFAMPTYWFSVPSNIKAVLDRLYCFLPSGKMQEASGKKAALIACCGDADVSIMDAIKITFEKSFALMSWEMVGEVLVDGVMNPGDVKNTDGLSRAASLAERI